MIRHTRLHACGICGGFDGGRRGNVCRGFTSDDGRWAHCGRDDGNGRLRQEGGGTFAHLLVGSCRCGRRHREGGVVSRATPVSMPPPVARFPEDVHRLWVAFAGHDIAGERYLADRHLSPAPVGIVAYNIGRTGDRWLDGKSRFGYRVGARLFDSVGIVRSFALRFCYAGEPPNGRKILNLSGAPASGMLFAISTFWDAAQPDDPILLCEGMTDFIAAAILTDAMAAERGFGVPWPFGAPGAGSVADAIQAFAPAFTGRRLVLALDTDDAGQKATDRAIAATRRIGARPCLYPFPPGIKDLCELVAKLEEAA
jgi:hypothetical protein